MTSVDTALTSGRRRSRRHPTRVALGGVALVVAWWVTSRGQPSFVLPGPGATWAALSDLARSGVLGHELLGTMQRCAAGTLLAISIGIPWGVLAGCFPLVADLGEAALRTLMSVPPILFVVVAMIWMGPGVGAVILVTTLVGIPLMVITSAQAVRDIDPDLREMTRIFRFSPLRRLFHLVLPSIAGPVSAGISVLVGQALRITVMAELLAASTGVGHAVALSRSNLRSDQLFAWALVLTLIALALQHLLVSPLAGLGTTPRHREDTPLSPHS